MPPTTTNFIVIVLYSITDHYTHSRHRCVLLYIMTVHMITQFQYYVVLNYTLMLLRSSKKRITGQKKVT